MTIIVSGTDGVTFPAGGVGNPAGSVVGTTDTQTVSNKTLEAGTLVGAGTSTLAPLDFASGTLVTTPIAGAFEYDGKLPYFTPQGTQRGLMPAAHFYRLNTAYVGTTATNTQPALGPAVTLSGSTVYAFEAFYMLIKSAGTTSHTLGFGFGGTATINNVGWSGTAWCNGSASTPNGSNIFVGFSTSVSNTVYTTNLTASGVWAQIKLHGTVSINAGGTFIPQYTISANPGGAYTTQIGSYFKIYPIGTSGANTSVGSWA